MSVISAPTAAQEPASPESVSNPYVRQIAGSWLRLKAAVDAFQDEVAACGEDIDLGYRGFDEREILVKTANHICYQLEKRAKIEFGGNAGRLEIDTKEWPERAVIAEEVRTFEPCRFWIALERQYGGGNGERIALEQAAQQIVREFGLATDKSGPQYKANGSLVLSTNIYVERAWSGTVSFTCAESLTNTILALKTFGMWANLPGAWAISAHTDWRTKKIRSREQISAAPWLTLVTFFERIQFTFEASAARQLLVFLSRYSSLGKKADSDGAR